MNSLLRFIIKYSFTIVFILLEIVCFTLLFSKNNFQKAKYLNSSNALAGSISDKWTSFTGYTKLGAINDSLAIENEKLKNILEKYRRDNIPAIEKSGFKYISAKVVSATVNRTKNFLTINKGLLHGVAQDMGVVGPNGIVGIVYTASDKFSSVLPIINPDTKISVKIDKNDYFGSLSWQGDNIRIASLTEIPGYVDVEVGDVIVTSGHSAIFPENIPVGLIKSFSKDRSTNFYTIDVELFTDFNNISYVYVINNSYLKEQKQFKFEDDD